MNIKPGINSALDFWGAFLREQKYYPNQKKENKFCKTCLSSNVVACHVAVHKKKKTSLIINFVLILNVFLFFVNNEK